MILCTGTVDNSDQLKFMEQEPLVDDSSSDEEEVRDNLKLTEEEQWGTIPGSMAAMAMALTCS